MSDLNLPQESREAQEWYNIWTLPPLKSQYHLYQAYNFVGELLTALSEARDATAVKIDLAKNLVVRIEELEKENKRLREAGNFLSSEYVEVVESNCDCERYTDVIGQVEEAVTKEEFAGMSLPIKCSLCEWADALSKDKT